MSTEQHEDIGAPVLEPLPPGAQLRSATGTSMEAHGLATCHVQIGRRVYVQRFIICHKMMTHVIIGRDFLSTYKLNIIWGDEGTMEVLKEGRPVARTLGGGGMSLPSDYHQAHLCATANGGLHPRISKSSTLWREDSFPLYPFGREC